MFLTKLYKDSPVILGQTPSAGLCPLSEYKRKQLLYINIFTSTNNSLDFAEG